MDNWKGTKGEWYLIASEPIEIATDKKTICFTSIQDYHNKDLEGQSNAKLIAAAPELLEALRYAVDILPEGGTKEEAKKAINKALK
ncbi:MAG: hypothetical protein GY928_02035 [Colwellia sp.]|nr:hypothetical protein [Colwellia sp.]